METNLSQVLKKHYQGNRRKYVFRNGMSLNQLAFEMRAQLGHRGVDASVLWKVLHGERLFTRPQLEVFCDILELSTEESLQLQTALAEDLVGGGVYELNLAEPVFLELFEQELSRIQHERTRKSLTQAYILAETTRKRISEVLTEPSTARFRKYLRRIRSLAAFEEDLIKRESRPPTASLRAGSLAVATELVASSREWNDVELLGHAYFTRGDLAYVLGSDNDVVKWQTQALQVFRGYRYLDLQVQARRELMLSKTRLEQPGDGGFEKEEQEITKLIESSPISKDHYYSLLEGKARAEGLRGNSDRAFSYVEEARTILEEAKGENSPIRRPQLARTEFELNLIFNKGDAVTLVETAEEAIREANYTGCIRYSLQIQSLLDKLTR